MFVGDSHTAYLTLAAAQRVVEEEIAEWVEAFRDMAPLQEERKRQIAYRRQAADLRLLGERIATALTLAARRARRRPLDDG